MKPKSLIILLFALVSHSALATEERLYRCDVGFEGRPSGTFEFQTSRSEKTGFAMFSTQDKEIPGISLPLQSTGFSVATEVSKTGLISIQLKRGSNPVASTEAQDGVEGFSMKVFEPVHSLVICKLECLYSNETGSSFSGNPVVSASGSDCPAVD